MGKKTQVTTTENKVPAYIEQGGQDLIRRITEQMDRPYQRYGGQRYAGLDDLENRAIGNVEGQVGNWRGGMDEGESLIRGAMGGFGGQTRYGGQTGYGQVDQIGGDSYEANLAKGAKDISSQRWGADQVDRYMNPYVDKVIDAKTKRLGRERDIAMRNVALRKATSGNFGGARHGVADAETERGYADTVEQSQATGYNDAWNQAVGAFGADADRDLDAQKSTADNYLRAELANQMAKNDAAKHWSDKRTDAAKWNSDTKLAQFNRDKDREIDVFDRGTDRDVSLFESLMKRRADGGRALFDSTLTRNDMQNRDNENLLGVGGLRRGIDQANKDFEFDEFDADRNKFYKDANLFAGAIGGIPHSTTSTQTQPKQGGGLFGKVLGTALAVGSRFPPS